MDIAMIGLGRMGANMAQRLHRGGHRVVGYDPGEGARQRAAEAGLEVVDSLAAAVAALPVPRVVWLMVPAGETVDQTLGQLTPHLAEGDIVIDGGNSNYQDSIRRAKALAEDDLGYVDCGTSGGVWGLQEGYSLMVGGEAPVVEQITPLLRTLAPAEDRGWARVGPSGAGHFTKMVHNGIEYGMMQAYAEGFALMERKQEMELDLAQVAEVWRHGSVVRSWLLDLSTEALKRNPSLDGIAPYVEDSGEGRWTVAEAIALDVPAPVITLSLLERLRSRESIRSPIACCRRCAMNSAATRSRSRRHCGGFGALSVGKGSEPINHYCVDQGRHLPDPIQCRPTVGTHPQQQVPIARRKLSKAGWLRLRGVSARDGATEATWTYLRRPRGLSHPAISRIACF